jgi:hypothetical protein
MLFSTGLSPIVTTFLISLNSSSSLRRVSFRISTGSFSQLENSTKKIATVSLVKFLYFFIYYKDTEKMKRLRVKIKKP